MKRLSPPVRFALWVGLLLSPMLFTLAFFRAVDWLNPVNSYIYLSGTIESEYSGSPKAGRYLFDALLENGRVVDVTQDVRDERLVPGTKVCVAIALRKRVEWRQTTLVSLTKCSQTK
jgi:hypothetical protein